MDSVESVEAVLKKIHKQYIESPKSIDVRALGAIYGAYLGESIRRHRSGAKWETDDPTLGEKTYPLIYKGSRAYPLAWCFRRITNGPEENVWLKLKVFLREDIEIVQETPNIT